MDPVWWREFLVGAAPEGVELHGPATPDRVRAAEQRLGVTLSRELRQVYLATDGMSDDLCPLDEMVERNLDEWAYWPDSPLRERLLAFGHNGCGEPFCLWLTSSPEVLCWYPIEDVANPVAGRLQDFYSGWWGGLIAT